MRQWNPQTCSSQCIQSSLDEMECSWILPSPALHSSVHGSLIGSILDDGTLFVHHLSSTSSSFTLYPQSGMKLDLITMGSERLAITTPDFYLLVTSHQVLILCSYQLGSINSFVGCTKWFHHPTYSKDSFLSNSVSESCLSFVIK